MPDPLTVSRGEHRSNDSLIGVGLNTQKMSSVAESNLKTHTSVSCNVVDVLKTFVLQKNNTLFSMSFQYINSFSTSGT